MTASRVFSVALDEARWFGIMDAFCQSLPESLSEPDRRELYVKAQYLGKAICELLNQAMPEALVKAGLVTQSEAAVPMVVVQDKAGGTTTINLNIPPRPTRAASTHVRDEAGRVVGTETTYADD